MSFTVAIVGRPNVGKSTLFNRLIGERKAIVDDLSGVTRDRHYGEVDWNGKHFDIIDTGGFVPNSEDIFEAAIREQVTIAMEEASLILMMVDVTTGITYLDEEIADMLRRSSKKVILVVNKIDNHSRLLSANEFYSLGLEHLFPVSSMTGSGNGELLDAIAAEVPEDLKEEDLENVPRFAIIGQPNVGKSSLLNSLIGENRNIVTPIAGTTRDSIHTRYQLYGKDILLIDTAGIRKKTKVHENLEFYSVIRAVKAIDDADVCIMMLDATQGITAQDLTIFSMAEKKRKGIVIAVNKWDLVEKETNTALDFEKNIKRKIVPFTDVPVIFISAIEKQRVMKVLDIALKVYKNRMQKISTSKLNDVLLKAIEKYSPPAYRGKMISIKYVTQLPTHSPSFAFFANHPREIRNPYRNYLENQMRENFDFNGVPINIIFRDK